ncbi:Hpt domain-containing protein [bacterium]|nr:Hpt domain-containing protein [bacterium]
MSAEGENAAVFDAEEAFERVDNDKELFFELVEMFFGDYDTVLVGIREAIEEGEPRHLEERAHSVKSALGNIGAMKAFYDALALEKLGRSGSVEGGAELLAALEEHVAAYRVEIEKHRS